jgi:flagellar biosynthetic protein FliQ
MDIARFTPDQATDLVRQTLLLAMMIAAPVLLVGLVVGLIISLVQAVTQIQEQSLSFIPKTAAMVVAAIILMPWISHRLLEYTASLLGSGRLP